MYSVGGDKQETTLLKWIYKTCLKQEDCHREGNGLGLAYKWPTDIIELDSRSFVQVDSKRFVILEQRLLVNCETI